MKLFFCIIAAVLVALPATRLILADCQTVSGGAETDAATGSLQNVGQAVIGRAQGGGVYLHAGIIPCLARAECFQVAPDLDQDCDVDADDQVLFAACAAGAGIAHSGSATCLQADFDGDGDVDAADYAALQTCYSGDGNPPNAHCAD